MIQNLNWDLSKFHILSFVWPWEDGGIWWLCYWSYFHFLIFATPPPPLQVHFFHPPSVTWFLLNKGWSSNAWNLVVILADTDICNYRIWKKIKTNNLVSLCKNLFSCQNLPFQNLTNLIKGLPGAKWWGQTVIKSLHVPFTFHLASFFSHPRPSLPFLSFCLYCSV